MIAITRTSFIWDFISMRISTFYLFFRSIIGWESFAFGTGTFFFYSRRLQRKPLQSCCSSIFYWSWSSWCYYCCVINTIVRKLEYFTPKAQRINWWVGDLHLVAALEFEWFRNSEIIHSYRLRWGVIMSVNQFRDGEKWFPFTFFLRLRNLIKREEVFEWVKLAFGCLYVGSFSYTKLIFLVETYKNFAIVPDIRVVVAGFLHIFWIAKLTIFWIF